jgi:Domain of unknown function (DUF4234)
MATQAQPPAPPAAPPVERVRSAYAARTETDYIAKFWTAFGWSILTCGIYSYYMIYQLMRRSREHNRRRLEMLDAATALAWERAQSAGRADQLRGRFEQVSAHVGVLRQMTADFRDPAIWLVILLVAGFLTGIGGVIVTIILYIYLDQDLVKHDAAERAAEAELVGIYTDLGADVPQPVGAPKSPHSYGGRVVAAIFSLGIYFLWWQYNIMEDGNRHFEENWAWEDGLRHALGG